MSSAHSKHVFIVTECLKSDYECVHNNDFNCRMHRQFAWIQHLLKAEFEKKSLASLLERDEESETE